MDGVRPLVRLSSRPIIYAAVSELLMNVHAKRILILIVGWAFILLGIVGLFLPILQGFLFILIGLAILSSEYVWAHHLLAKLRQRFPGVSGKADEAAEKASSWLRRWFRPGDSC